LHDRCTGFPQGFPALINRFSTIYPPGFQPVIALSSSVLAGLPGVQILLQQRREDVDAQAI
jgi:hypothetical protein